MVGFIVGGAIWFSIMVLASPALAHTQEALDEWQANWVEQVIEEGLTSEAMAEWIEMRERHGCDWPGTTCVVTLPYQDRTTSPAQVTSFPQGVEQWRGLVGAYFQPADIPWAMRVMACESRGNPYAKNPTSTASGLFQFLRGWWSGSWGYPAFDPFDPESNVKAAAWLYYTEGPHHWVCK